ncbi:hypothetical protein [Rheinheimera sediminis]|uniref:hypothetical protein n=1 Tax=Rheinheimera sp. YQF-1 TaxID=2499626 RepID=UPI001C945198|nr:hypothetical protein [Rheinheimera sp. YQF-1]
MTAEIQVKFSSYPLVAQKQLEEVRRLIFAVAEEDALGVVEESLKWGKPAIWSKGAVQFESTGSQKILMLLRFTFIARPA